LFYVANLMEVMHNVAQWNIDIGNPKLQQLWGKRRITYFVYNPYTKEFAPSKFCAYIVTGKLNISHKQKVSGATMNVALYTKIPREETIFDGYSARKHLEDNLAMRLIKLEESPDLFNKFKLWHHTCQDFVIIPDKGVSVLIPPIWY
jgi:hypothetical protein